MGYADITTTMNIYAEATKEKKQQAMANLNGKMANHGEAWKLVSQMMTPQGDQPPMFWQIAQIMSIKGNCKDELDNLIQEFMSFAYCFVSEIMKKYPNGGYDREKLLPYLKNLMPAEAPKN